VLAGGEYSNPARLPRHTLMFLVLSGIAIELSWIFYFKALQQGQASLAAPVDASSLVITIVLAAIFLEAAIIWRIACGALLITAGRLIIVLQR
jgi:transporter family protein